MKITIIALSHALQDGKTDASLKLRNPALLIRMGCPGFIRQRIPAADVYVWRTVFCTQTDLRIFLILAGFGGIIQNIAQNADQIRIGDPEEMDEIGFEDYIFGEGVSIIEWAELIEELLPPETVFVKIEKDTEKGFDYRKITLDNFTEQ